MIIKKANRILPIIYSLIIMLALLTLSTAAGQLSRQIGLHETNIVIIYLLAVLLTARFLKGYIYGILASVISIFAYNYFFTEPYYTFAVDDPGYIITFIIMTISAILTSTVTSHFKKSVIKAQEKESETKALYTITNHLTDASDIQNIAGIAVNIISDIMKCKAACLCFDENEMPEKTYIQQISSEKQIHRNVENIDYIKKLTENSQSGYFVSEEFYDWLIYGKENILGIIRIPKESAFLMNDAQTRLLRAMIESTALAMDRLRSAQQQIKYRDETLQERYRGNLLRAISHDLRTPLSGIMGTSEMLMDMTKSSDPRYNLAEQIHEDADWLHSLVENILSLTRLQDGKLLLNKQPEAVEEVVGGAVYHVMQNSPGQEIKIDIPYELLLVPMDAKLIQQVLINLLENAIKHTPEGKEISVSVIKNEKLNCVIFKVADEGEGIKEEDLPKIFEMFYTTRISRAEVKQGIGLGLSICDAIIKAHGGDIEASNRSDGQGAVFTFTLPMGVVKNE